MCYVVHLSVFQNWCNLVLFFMYNIYWWLVSLKITAIFFYAYFCIFYVRTAGTLPVTSVIVLENFALLLQFKCSENIWFITITNLFFFFNRKLVVLLFLFLTAYVHKMESWITCQNRGVADYSPFWNSCYFNFWGWLSSTVAFSSIFALCLRSEMFFFWKYKIVHEGKICVLGTQNEFVRISNMNFFPVVTNMWTQPLYMRQIPVMWCSNIRGQSDWPQRNRTTEHYRPHR